MPKEKTTVKFISDELSKSAKRLINTEQRRNIAIKQNISLGYVNAIIYQTRYNHKVEQILLKLVENEIKKLTK